MASLLILILLRDVFFVNYVICDGVKQNFCQSQVLILNIAYLFYVNLRSPEGPELTLNLYIPNFKVLKPKIKIHPYL